ncbi:hypothetical protein ACFX12_041367 [Malus domestica]
MVMCYHVENKEERDLLLLCYLAAAHSHHLADSPSLRAAHDSKAQGKWVGKGLGNKGDGELGKGWKLVGIGEQREGVHGGIGKKVRN